jgi:prevent-host-death family protein
MKFLSVRDLRGKAAQVWQELPQEKEIVITNNGRPVAILSSVNESSLEDSLKAFRRTRASNALNNLQRASMEQGKDSMSLTQINAEITAARKKRKK